MSPSSESPGRAQAGLRPDVLVFATRATACEFVARRIREIVLRAARSRSRAVLGLATGRSPLHVYRRLCDFHREGLSFACVETFNLDEYWPIDPRHPASFHRYMREHLFDPIGIPRERAHMPDGAVPEEEIEAHCLEYERAIERSGGIDLQLLGIGANGHIGFNEPGSAPDSRTRKVLLHPGTLRDNQAAFGGTDRMPRAAITMGIGTILEARRIVVLALGEAKAQAVRAAVEGPVTPDVPASWLRRHPGVVWVLDRAAAGGLSRAG